MSVYPGFLFFSFFFLSFPPSLSLFSWNLARALCLKHSSVLCLVKDGEEKKRRRRGRGGGRREKEPGRRWRLTKGPRARKGKFMYVPWRNSAICVEFLLAHQFFGFPKDLGQADSCEKPSRPFSRAWPDLSSPNDPRFLGELRPFRETLYREFAINVYNYVHAYRCLADSRWQTAWTNETKE